MTVQKLKPGDHVIIENCLEAEHHIGEVWLVTSEPWILSVSEVVNLEGYSGAFGTKFLRKTDLPLHRNRTLKKSDRVGTLGATRKMKRAAEALPDSLFDGGEGQEV